MRGLGIVGNGFVGTHLPLRPHALGYDVQVMGVGPRRTELEHEGLEYQQAGGDDREPAAAPQGFDTVSIWSAHR